MFVPTIDHVSLNVADLERTIAFYGALGFSRVERWEFEGQPGADVIDPLTGARLELATDADGARADGRLAHLSLVVEDIDAAHEVVVARGRYAEDVVTRPSGARTFDGRDPDGTLIEFRSGPLRPS